MTVIIDPRKAFDADPDDDHYVRMVREKSAKNDSAHKAIFADASARHYAETDPRRIFELEGEPPA
jgi:hypothetical protein